MVNELNGNQARHLCLFYATTKTAKGNLNIARHCSLSIASLVVFDRIGLTLAINFQPTISPIHFLTPSFNQQGAGCSVRKVYGWVERFNLE
jgi:hypothetical protein